MSEIDDISDTSKCFYQIPKDVRKRYDIRLEWYTIHIKRYATDGVLGKIKRFFGVRDEDISLSIIHPFKVEDNGITINIKNEYGYIRLWKDKSIIMSVIG